MYLFMKCKDSCWEFVWDNYSYSDLFTVHMLMYLYAFDEYVWHDRILSAPEVKLPIGSLFVSQWRKYLVLGEMVAFAEMYAYFFKGTPEEVLWLLLSDKEVELIHYMAHTYFALYKNIVPLFVDDPLAVVLSSVSKKKLPVTQHIAIKWSRFVQVEAQGQQIIVFPDLWTIQSMMSQFPDLDYAVWHHGLTTKQQNRIFDALTKGSLSILCCTHGGIFHRWAYLRSIIIVEPDMRYYHNYQEPRYSVPNLLLKSTEIYGATMESLRY